MQDTGAAANTFVTITGGDAVLLASNDVLLTDVDASASAFITADADGTLAEGIFDNSADETIANVTAFNVALSAGDGVADDSTTLDTVATNLAAITDSGDINIANTGCKSGLQRRPHWSPFSFAQRSLQTR